jgi:hypothetical protein
MWNVFVYTEEAAETGDMDANHVIGSPIRYGDTSAYDGADANEALPLVDGREYQVYLGRGCSTGGGNGANTIEGTFVYVAPEGGVTE